MKWRLRRKRTVKPRASLHYKKHKEISRMVVHEKLTQWSAVLGLTYNRVAIRDTKRNWGSCTSLKNLNFNYKILFLPSHLQDYIVVHELCHLRELNHKEAFWVLVAEHIPQYKDCIRELREIERNGFKKNDDILSAYSEKKEELVL